jgi:predicted AAA+ superfamily ATPase
MIAPISDFIAVLNQFNPWWSGARFPDLPKWKRAAFNEIIRWIENPPGGRALLVSGARQIGKTTLFIQTIDYLLDNGISPNNILYVTFDHPLLKLLGLEGLIKVWREIEPAREGFEYLFLDEIQATKDWQVWIKHQVDFEKKRRIALTGSATPLISEHQESGVGRWHTLRLATLSFYEYLQIKSIDYPKLPQVNSLTAISSFSEVDLIKVGQSSLSLVPHFLEYLLRGGFPQCAQIESITLAQKILREDIVDKVLKRDMTALFGVRRVLELEQVFLYLCLHSGGMLDIQELCKSLQVKKQTAMSYIDLLESTHLIHKLLPFGYGKEILRGKQKIYLADAAISPSVLLKGKGLLENDTALGLAVETAFFKHVFTRYYNQSISFSYWKNKRDQEVDIVAETENHLIPFEVKYRSSNTGVGDLKGFISFCKEKQVDYGYVITKEITDFGILKIDNPSVTIFKIPAHLACYWLGRSEVEPSSEE